MRYNYDLIVIGAGSGGLAAAKQAAKLGKRVAIAEKEEIGGTCVNRGCIPTKLMVYAADFAKQQELAINYGWVNPEGLFDWSEFRQNLQSHIQSIRQSQENHLDGIDIIRGQAAFQDPHTIQVQEMTFTSEFILIAVGSRPRMPDIRGIDLALSSRDIFHLEALPESLVIVGGGYIGVEFSQILKSFGCRVTLVESSDHLLDGFDHDIQLHVQRLLESDQIQIVTEGRLESIEKNVGTLMATLDDGRSFKGNAVLCALGRTANIDTLGLDKIGVDIGENKIRVNQHGETNLSSIFAVGDCTDRMLLTPVAKAEADVAINAMFKDYSETVNYQWVPSAVFMHPEISAVGLTEQEARDKYDEINIYCETFTPLKYSLKDEPTESVIKIIVDPKTQYIVGLHLVSPRAADIVQSLVPALTKGLTKQELDETVGIHPSIGEEIFAL